MTFRETVFSYVHRYFSDYTFKTLVTTFGSTAVRLAFTIYNLVTFLIYRNPWNLTIMVYYIVLISLRAFLFHMSFTEDNRPKIHRHVFLAMVLMNLSLVAPLSMMVLGKRVYRYGLVPAIGIAAYTFYRISMSVFHVFRSKMSRNPFIREIRTLNLMDSMVSVLILQNTLVNATSKTPWSGIMSLMEITSGAIWLVLVGVSVASYLSVRKQGLGDMGQLDSN